ncbi:GspE/PulE family protein [Noviherbaspirillum pedocola]|uniref:Flp pilus assembly complex ATPase component TadA n=1 Tax=Noviherbaspirillum pedocola TaxID=2801341 RepID=A0A934SXN7_9BURK|nr:ATPase, T2SS/T4P/T4SS family [Noviherbaspirillum pedocola]MBK4738751.1 Flp pilus assembly complex ATPase component TadA [Noviherbaspirillum pedocola]
MDMPAELSDVELCASWGWEDPPAKVMTEARSFLSARSKRSGDYLVECNVITRDELERMLSTKPDHIQTLEWIVQHHDTATPYYDRFLAYADGIAYYDTLQGFTPHECMKEKAVLNECERGDFVVLATDRNVPVLVAGSIQAYYLRKSLGRTDRAKSAVLSHLRNLEQVDALLYAVSRRDQVAAFLNLARNRQSDGGAGVYDESAVWIGSSIDTQSRPESRELARILDTAIQNNATDIDMRTQPDGSLSVLMRQFGDLRAIGPTSISAEIGPRALSFLMRRSGANPSGTRMREPNDGHLHYRGSNVDVQLRLSFIPLNHPGETVQQMSTSIRIMRQEQSSIELGKLQLEEKVVDDLTYALRLTQGLIIVAGPTNTGKSTTIAGAVGKHVSMFGSKQKRLSVEDPIERWVRGLTQIQVPHQDHDSEGDRFNTITRAVKRHDPDLIWLGEVRDRETAEACVHYASSGHIVLSTLHATDCLVALDVLAKMVKPDQRFQLAESMLLVVSQRLVKQLCPHCKKVQDITEEEKRLVVKYAKSIGAEDYEIPEVGAYPVGCDECTGGYVSILPINETLPVTRDVKDAWLVLLERSDSASRQVIYRARSVTLLQAALQRVRMLQTDIAQVLV